MFNKKLIFISIFLLFVLAIGFASASENITEDMLNCENDYDGNDNLASEELVELDNVASFDDSDEANEASSDELLGVDDIGGSSKTFEAITKKISNSKEGDTIRLSGEYTSTGSPIFISKSITLQGSSNVIFDGKGLGSIIFTSPGITLNLKNITFKNSLGEAINLACDANIQNCKFENNDGGAIGL